MISIVIPVYNVEKYVSDCLESIIKQTFSQWEVIMINDGSSDGSVAICEKFCEQDDRFKLLEQSNHGVSVARNAGIELCRGEYVLFMDADDTILPNTLEDLNQITQKTKVDIISFQYQKIVNKSEIHEVEPPQELHVITGDEALTLFLREQKIGISMCTKLVKRSIVENIQFEVGRTSNEDKFYLFETLLAVNTALVLQEQYYCYWTRENSATTKPFDERWFDVYYFAKKIYLTVCEKKPEFEPDARYQLLSSCYFLIRQMDNKKASKSYPEEYRKLCKEIREFRIADIWNNIMPQRRKGILILKYAPLLYKMMTK